jgi:hypothetical protein
VRRQVLGGNAFVCASTTFTLRTLATPDAQRHGVDRADHERSGTVGLLNLDPDLLPGFGV